MTTPKFILQIEREEGRQKRAYADPLTHGEPWTVGVGHTGPEVTKNTIWDDAMITAQRDADCYKAAFQCYENFPWFGRLNEARKAVLISMVHQMGMGRSPNKAAGIKGSGLLGFAKAMHAIENAHWALAETEMLDSKWAKQTPARAKRHARQMASGEWE